MKNDIDKMVDHLNSLNIEGLDPFVSKYDDFVDRYTIVITDSYTKESGEVQIDETKRGVRLRAGYGFHMQEAPRTTTYGIINNYLLFRLRQHAEVFKEHAKKLHHKCDTLKLLKKQYQDVVDSKPEEIREYLSVIQDGPMLSPHIVLTMFDRRYNVSSDAERVQLGPFGGWCKEVSIKDSDVLSLHLAVPFLKKVEMYNLIA